MIVQQLFDGKRLTDSEIRTFWEGISITVGVPYIGARRVIKAIEEEDIRELMGGESRDVDSQIIPTKILTFIQPILLL